MSPMNTAWWLFLTCRQCGQRPGLRPGPRAPVPVRALAAGAAQVYRKRTSPLGACGQQTWPVRLSARWHGRSAYPGLIRPIKSAPLFLYRSVSNQKNRPANGPFRGILLFAVIAGPCDPRRGPVAARRPSLPRPPARAPAPSRGGPEHALSSAHAWRPAASYLATSTGALSAWLPLVREGPFHCRGRPLRGQVHNDTHAAGPKSVRKR